MKKIIYKCDSCNKTFDRWQLWDIGFDKKHICRKCDDIEKLNTP
jgi:hypothetical protein